LFRRTRKKLSGNSWGNHEVFLFGTQVYLYQIIINLNALRVYLKGIKHMTDLPSPYRPVEMMTAEEARKRVAAINTGLNNVRGLLLDFYEREGWKALGYESWRTCVTAEFGQSERHLYRQLEAAQIEMRICPIGQKLESDELSHISANENSDPITESHLRPLTKVPPEDQATVYHLAQETAPKGKVTAKHVEKIIREIGEEKKQRTPRPTPKFGDPFKLAGLIGNENPADLVQKIINLIDTIRDDNPHCKEALKKIALHVWNRQHKVA
jgi:hypothetical protein